MQKINFEAGTQVSPAKVTIDNVEHEVTPAEWEGNTPLSPYVLNLMQNNIDNGKLETTNMSDAYDSTKTYGVGDYCIKDNILYRCKTAITTAEEWTSGHWEQTSIATELNNRLEFEVVEEW